MNEKTELLDSDKESTANSRDTRKTSTRHVVTMIAIISYLWFATIFVYYGLNINSVYLEYWDKYISYIVSDHGFIYIKACLPPEYLIQFHPSQIVCIIELPGYFITNYLMDKIGRKKTLFIGMMGSGIFCIISEFITGEMQKTICFVFGKLLITIAFSCLYIFTIEVFPTNLRHRFFSICSVMGRIGSILTPLTPILALQIWHRLPLIIFSALSFTSAFLMWTLPETLNRKLPNNVNEAFS